ncbi:tetratricopeptide repeat protein [Tumebacillus flagellatus]|uniref:tetratricopeptide repeat protein n=1 Tax=Tumebacillus flagellatus TaxID=1157490 RepID=UPI000689FAC2|nr:tetratricopeptide repeat protein [Tumebacillus flagellatus]
MDQPKSQQVSTGRNNVIPFQVDATFYFERAVHYLDRHDLKNALKNFRKASELEPDNPVNHCNLAGILSELGEFEQSNQILLKILSDIDPDMVECFFYMANNYANLGQYDLAEEYAARYLDAEPQGEFASDAEEMLQILVQEFGGGKVLHERAERKEAEQRDHDTARQLLEEGKFMEASEYLEQAIAEHPDNTAPRNNLSLAYYYLGELEKAIDVAIEVLELDQSNVHALCNLAVFYQHLGKKEALQDILECLRKLYPLYFDHTYKLATTMGILGEHSAAYRLFRQLLRWSDRQDPQLLHCVAAAAANLGFYQKAERIWEEIKNLDEDPKVADFFLARVHDAERTGRLAQPISYQYHIPFQEQFKQMKVQLQSGQLGAWHTDPMVRSSLFWALRHGDGETKRQVIQAFALIADKEVEHALREFVKNPAESDQLKRHALYVLRHMGAEGPFHVHLEQEEHLWRVQSMPQDDLLTLRPEWQEVLDTAVSQMSSVYGDEACLLARDVWTQFLHRTFTAPPRIGKTQAWSAALEYTVLRRQGIKATYTEVAARYGVTAGSVSKISRMLAEPTDL